MQLFKLFSIHNIITYFSFFISLIFIFFLSYKYLYLEQSIYLLNNKLNKLEIEYNNPNVYSNTHTSKTFDTAEFIMNEIFNEDNSCSINNKCKNTNEIKTDNSVIIDTIDTIDTTDTTDTTDKPSSTEIFDLKKDNEDKESTVSGALGLTGGGHATKKALMKLTIDKLKSKCEERKISTEGTKNQLADRIIVHDNSIEITDISDITDI